ncbi:methyltransferase domain-containing protein [bacterium]|nr:methyltransferase domain-containing protein [bacterium]
MIRFAALLLVLLSCQPSFGQLFRRSNAGYSSGYSFDGNSYHYKGKDYVLGVDDPVSPTCPCEMCVELRQAKAANFQASFQRSVIPQQVLLKTVSSDIAVVRAMLEIAEVCKGDVVLDPGCGDGRILVEAAKLGANAIGIELNKATADATFTKLRNNPLIRVYRGDSTKASFQNANVVVMFMYPEVIDGLSHQFLKMPVGSRVVSLSHDIPGFQTTKYNFGEQSFYVWIKKELWKNYQIQEIE